MPPRRSTPQWKIDERRFPVRVRVLIPRGGFGGRLNEMHAWLTCRLGRDGYGIWDEAGRGDGDALLLHVGDLAVAAEFVQAFGLELAVRK